MHRTVLRGGVGSRARRQADFVVGSRASEEVVMLGASDVLGCGFSQVVPDVSGFSMAKEAGHPMPLKAP